MKNEPNSQRAKASGALLSKLSVKNNDFQNQK